MSPGASPRVGFVIGGVQKGGTTALAQFLSAHPGLVLPQGKEAHVFDAAGFDERDDVAAIDARYAPHFDTGDSDPRLHGDATPIYALHPRFVERIHRYNPGMRWILILRDPVERLLSNYHMERGWGRETRPLWQALLLERQRLAGHMDDFSVQSPLRRCSYRLRSDYARQLDLVLARFPASQVLVLRTEDLAERPAQTYAAACGFLGVPLPDPLPSFTRAFEGSYASPPRDGLRWRLLRWWLRREIRDMDRRHGLRWPHGDRA